MTLTPQKFDEATLAQVISADPLRLTWLSANAGSGKTRVLTDRVSRLLLQSVPPERILCLTYTKAAAAEMQNRLFAQLGKWAMLADTELIKALAKLGVAEDDLGTDTLAHARTLFARAVEAPGGLKIQTIHSFCASVLRRFPVEAHISPAFEEMDDRNQTDLISEILEDMATDSLGHGRIALDAVAPFVSDLDGHELAKAVINKREAFDPAAAEAQLRQFFELGTKTFADLIAETFMGDEQGLCDKLAKLLTYDNTRQKRAKITLETYDWSKHSLASIAAIEDVFVNGSTAKSNPDQAKGATIFNTDVRKEMGDDFPALCDFMERLATARQTRRALIMFEKSNALHQFAAEFLTRYDRAKERRGWLDFDDLIRLTNRLLTKTSLAQWVLFRLDGGIDHMLVDEAQDTSPAQWQIIAKLAEEFAAGQSARDGLTRTIFVVGDKKQSIYSFQGADPEGFDRMRDEFDHRLAAVQSKLHKNVLKYSFRSAPSILQLVDRVAADQAYAGLGQDVEHAAYFSDLPGRVDIWPAIPKTEKANIPEWDSPVDLVHDSHHTVILADQIADFISQKINSKQMIRLKGVDPRPVRPRDFLILLRKRSDLFHQIIRALKSRNLPIMGADRLRISAELAVRDLTALMNFLATPEDDLSLAAFLRSPLGGLSEDQLYELAHGRAGTLWQALSNHSAYAGIVSTLRELRNKADFERPYEILENILTQKDGRRALIARLGQEAEDGINSLLQQAMSYERHDVPSIAGFAAWLRRGDVTIKRDMSGDDDQIRVMSIHGAKGLEAPIVILPDTARQNSRGGGGVNLLQPKDGPLIWANSSDDLDADLREVHEARKAAQNEEENRLLYVAMTRAETWLVVAAAGDLSAKSGDKLCWYDQIRAAAENLPNVKAIDMAGQAGLRLENGNWDSHALDTSEPASPQGVSAQVKAALASWARQTPPQQAKDKPALSPSDLGETPAPSPQEAALKTQWRDAEAAKLRGRRLHLLLEHLPKTTPAAWAATAPMILAAEGDCSPEECAALLREAERVLTHPNLRELFVGDALAEVPLTAFSKTLNHQVYGVIDRLILRDAEVLAVDFKSNQIVPQSPAEVSEGYLRQMAAYGEMLRALYPTRVVKLAILWTSGPSLMELPDDLLEQALQRAAGKGVGS